MKWSVLIEQYLQARRDLGYALTIDGKILEQFAVYAQSQNARMPLNVELVQQWARLAPSNSEIAIARRMSIVRAFSKYLHSVYPDSVVVPVNLVGHTHRRLPPFIFSQHQIKACLEAASNLLPCYGIRPLTIRTMLGLLVSSGLRPGEAIRLKKNDIDIEKGTLTIKQSKNWQRRIVPLDSSTVISLKKYYDVRELFEPLKHSDRLLLMDSGEAITIDAADHAFQIIRKTIHLDCKVNGRYPRLYDFRHTFVCRRIQAWYEAGLDVNAFIPKLSHYLGHKSIENTYWYINATPELMKLAASRFEECCGQGGQL